MSVTALRVTQNVATNINGPRKEAWSRQERPFDLKPHFKQIRVGVPGKKQATRSRRIEARVAKDVDNEDKGGRVYVNITGFPFPLRPFLERKTIRREVEPGTIWVYEQEQGLGFTNVTTNVRMTVIKLQSGGLWVHAPVAPTSECLRLLKEHNAPVEYIILPTFAYEHKIFVGPFSRRFPKAQVWIAPSQWSWPLNLPPPLFGIFSKGILKTGDATAPWADEIKQKVFSSPKVGIGPYVEVAFFHKKTRTLLVTDAVVLVPRTPPEVVRPEALLDAARDGLAVKVLSKGKKTSSGPVRDTPENRLKGWQRMVLQILFFGPSNLLEPAKSFDYVAGRLIVSPVVRTLVFNKVPDTVKEWVDDICKDWSFRQIIPCHFVAPIPASPRDFKAAFAFLEKTTGTKVLGPLEAPVASLLGKTKDVLDADLQTLDALDRLLVKAGAVNRTGL